MKVIDDFTYSCIKIITYDQSYLQKIFIIVSYESRNVENLYKLGNFSFKKLFFKYKENTTLW